MDRPGLGEQPWNWETEFLWNCWRRYNSGPGDIGKSPLRMWGEKGLQFYYLEYKQMCLGEKEVLSLLLWNISGKYISKLSRGKHYFCLLRLIFNTSFLQQVLSMWEAWEIHRELSPVRSQIYTSGHRVAFSELLLALICSIGSCLSCSHLSPAILLSVCFIYLFNTLSLKKSCFWSLIICYG